MKPECADICQCLKADHESLRRVIDVLEAPEIGKKRKRAIFRRMLPLLQAHTYGEEHSLLSEANRAEELRPFALKAIEEHELAEVMLARIQRAADDELWAARLNVFCNALTLHMDETEKSLPLVESAFSEEKREELAMRYLDTRNKFSLNPIIEVPVKPDLVYDQTGKIGYIIAWLLGVPAWILLLVFLIRG